MFCPFDTHLRPKMILVSPTYTVLKGKLLVDNSLLIVSWKMTYP